MEKHYKEIVDCLRELIEVHDFIIIPDFGALVMQLEPAELSVSQNVIFPPRKKILFNPLLKHSDGLLTSELQKKLGIEFVLAQSLVQRFVQTLYVLLDTKRRVDIEEIGYFYKDIEENVLFECTMDPFYLSESFGLSSIQVSVIETKSVFQSNEIGNGDRREIIRLDVKNIYKAAVIIFIVFSLLIYWYIVPVDIKTNLANVLGYSRTSDKIKISRTVYPLFQVKYDVISIKKKPLNNSTTKPLDKVTEKKHSAVFSIVVGCFKVEQNAQRLTSELNKKQIKASIRWNSEKQLFVVSIGIFQNKLEAVKRLNDLKVKGVLNDGWIKEEIVL